MAELIKEQKTMEQERVGVQNEVEAQKHSWNVKKVGPWGRGLDGEGRWEKIARSGKVEQGRLTPC